MIALDYRDKRPLNEQVAEKIMNLIAQGGLSPGEKLPSVRNLAVDLSINPNTVQRAFKMLEDEGLIESRAGAKSFMTLSSGTIEGLREELRSEDIRSITRSLRQSGLSKEDALSLIDRYWDEDE